MHDGSLVIFKMASDSESGNEFEVAEILNKRKRGNIVEYLVRWKDFGTQEDSWEPQKNLKHAQKFIDIFNKSSVRKSKRRSKSRTRSNSRSRSRSRSSSRGRPKKESPSHSSKVIQEKATPTVSSIVTEKLSVSTNSLSRSPRILKEAVHQWPGKYEMTTETRTESKPSEATTRSTYQKKTETIVTSSSKMDRTEPVVEKSKWSQTWRKYFHPTSSDYPILVIFSCIAIIVLSFLLERYVNFSKIGESIVGLWMGLLAWLSNLLQSNKSE
ncbi:hypothetical protein CHS0354_035905 [Potamilus streckersoni]|uniref:Chromo domain-containing protein n=1 Tax=Potamilus streckersoni TaxID=2493646 RepID=A0AAE0W7M6_9BIVA|nr:hypothetical protein CHS0354_035905 [Potamilus streckersoni]